MLNPADDLFIAELAAHLPAGTLRPPEPRHLEEPRGRWRGAGGVLALPRCTGEVATILARCARRRVAVVPRGGGTGLVGGQVAPEGPAPVILSLERMAAVRALHPEENTIVVEAGLTLAATREAARAAGRRFPLSLASEGSARIGGCLATNAGGAGVLRWGSARDLCLGLEAVMADGRVLGGLRRLRKDNTGYDLRQLLIGSEGTLGVITAAALRLVAPPASEATALVAVAGPAAALELLGRAEARATGCVSAFELIAGAGLRPLPPRPPPCRSIPSPTGRSSSNSACPPGSTPPTSSPTSAPRPRRRGLSARASSPARRPSGPNSGTCANASPRRRGGSGRSRTTTSPCRSVPCRPSCSRPRPRSPASAPSASPPSAISATATSTTTYIPCPATARTRRPRPSARP